MAEWEYLAQSDLALRTQQSGGSSDQDHLKNDFRYLLVLGGVLPGFASLLVCGHDPLELNRGLLQFQRRHYFAFFI